MKASYYLTGKNIGKIVLRIDGNIIEPIVSDKVIEDVETRVSEIKNSPSVYTNELDILNEYLRIAKLAPEKSLGVENEVKEVKEIPKETGFNWEDAKKKMEGAVKNVKTEESESFKFS